MKLGLILLFTIICKFGYGQVVLNADGAGDTYELITSVLAPGHNPIETPDCNHASFGNHIDEIFDAELNANVFRFFIHTSPDNDRCINFDRQRNEIKAYDKSPDSLLGIEGEKVIYNWKFKLNSGFQSSPNFTHLHQLKSVGGSLASMPMYTLTTRKGSPDQMELRYAETNSQVTLEKADLASFIGVWLEVTETVKYGVDGTYEIEIKRVNDGEVLFAYTNESIVNWREDADFVRPKWGIYRSLLNDQDLRDEEVLFANFSIEEVDPLSTDDFGSYSDQEIVFSNLALGTVHISSLPLESNLIRMFALDGKMVLTEVVESKREYDLDVSSLPGGTYIINVKSEHSHQSKLIVVN